MNKRRVHYVLSTHWDREWHQSFQDYRHRLVQLMDRVLDGLTDGRLKGPFQTDGQAIILEDYLEIRPERRRQVEQLARERRLVIGPWYTMPDEFLVSGESLIRNLKLGRQIARAMGGEPSNAGFICDIFGHNSQLPQLFAGFGIRGGFLWRGLNTSSTRHVRWRGADGTELPCYRFGPVGYSTFAAVVRRAFDHDHEFEAAQASADLEEYIKTEAKQTEIEPVLLFDGGDHQEWDQEVYAVLLERMERTGGAYELVHTCLDDYLAEMLAQVELIGTVVSGELREPGWDPAEEHLYVIPGVLSSRVWIKQANTECQALLCQWAEPMSAFARAALDREYPQGFLNVAWKWLLQNHPHDSIGGCSIDVVHQDMQYRFSQCRQIGNRLTIDAARRLAAAVEGELAPDELRVAVFNPLTQPVDQTIELTLQLPTDWPAFNEFFGYEPKPAFRIYDSDDREAPYQRLAQAMKRNKVRLYEKKFPQPYRTHDVRVSLPAWIPALGYTTFTVRPGEAGRPTRYPATPGLATSDRSMANEYLEVTIEPNGSLTLTDKRSGQSYSRLLTFEDIADIGDGWFHGAAVNDQGFSSAASRAEVALVHDGPMVATFRIRITMAVPEAFLFEQMVRSGRLVDLVIDSLVSLRPKSDYLEVQTTVHNNAGDHRLRALLPSGAQEAMTYLADSPFDVVERPISLRADNHLYHEPELETKPQQSWTAVHNDRRGLAVISAGLMESAVRDLPERPLALTLFRSTGRTVFTSGEPDGQLQGPMTFHFWLMPLAGQPDRVRLCRLGQQLAAGLRDIQLRPRDIRLYRGEQSLPPAAGFLQVNGPVVVTSVAQAEAELEIRLFNPTLDRVQAAISLAEQPETIRQPVEAQQVDFEGNPLDEPAIPVERGLITLALEAKEIITVRLR